MYDYIVDHAIKNVWCTPTQDTQYIVAPIRLTTPLGVLNTVRVMDRQMALPTRGVRYHVFQIGHLYPTVLGLFPHRQAWEREAWQALSQCCTENQLIIDIYRDSGIQIPRHEVYYLFTDERDLLFAIKENRNIPIDYAAGKIYLRVYSNAFYQSIRADSQAGSILVEGTTVKTQSDILEWQSRYAAQKEKPGHCYAFINGYLRQTLDLTTVAVGDTIEYVYDRSIKLIVTFDVNELPTFVSTLDSVRKYLLHYPAEETQEIDYLDDIDFFLIHAPTAEHYKGLYYHKNEVTNCRMVTHHDYSVPVQTIQYFKNQLELGTVLPANQIKLRLHIRHSGYERPLVFETNRLHELYKLDDSRIQMALTGTDAVMPCWSASILENSDYVRIMQSQYSAIDRTLVENAYGYNALSVLLGKTPEKAIIYSSKPEVHVPYGLQLRCTAYEYDAEGHLLGTGHHVGGSVYTAVHATTALIEIISGWGSHSPNVTFGRNALPVPIYDNYRVYRCFTTAYGWDVPWTDITDSDEYTIVDNVVQLADAHDLSSFLMVRTDADFLAYDLNITPTDGNLRFDLSEMENRDGELKHTVLQVPLGELDVFLNGYSLIENLDYVVQFPEIVITNKRFLTALPNTTSQWIHIRFTGFCQSNFERQVTEDVGFIEHGVVSNNFRFNLRDDRVLRLVVNGATCHRDDFVFSELHAGISILNALNGQPYSIRDIVVPMRGNTNSKTYTLRAASKVIDAQVSDYLTRYHPQPDRPAVSAITERYPIFSPFLSKILYDLFTEHLSPSLFDQPLTDNRVLELCQPYEDWLRFDPTQSEHAVDDHYVIIHPHNHANVIGLPLPQYRFLLRVNQLYCRNCIDLSPFVSINTF